MWTNLLPTQPEDAPLPRASDFHESDKLRYRSILHDMLHAGVGIVRTLELRSANATMDGTNAVIEAAASYERVTRAMRRTILLATKLTDPNPQPAKHARDPAAQPAPAQPQPSQRPARESTERDHPDRPDPLDDAPAEPARPPTHDSQDDLDPLEDEPEPDDAPDDDQDPLEAEAHAGPLDLATIPAQIAALRIDLGLPPLPDPPRKPPG